MHIRQGRGRRKEVGDEEVADLDYQSPHVSTQATAPLPSLLAWTRPASLCCTLLKLREMTAYQRFWNTVQIMAGDEMLPHKWVPGGL